MKQDALNTSLLPRNKKQVYNTQQMLKQEKQHDDLYEVYSFGRQYPDVIVKLEMLPSLIAIQMNPDMNVHFSSLQNNLESIILHYDTTFGIGAYFTSILSMRHPLFKHEPVVTIAVMFHEKTNEAAHQTFLETVNSKIYLNTSKTIVITDREKSIINAIKNCIPEAQNIFCWNHIRKVDKVLYLIFCCLKSINYKFLSKDFYF